MCSFRRNLINYIIRIQIRPSQWCRSERIPINNPDEFWSFFLLIVHSLLGRIRKRNQNTFAVLRIHEILVRIRMRIRGSIPGSGSRYFRQWSSKHQQNFCYYYFLKVLVHHFSKFKRHKKSHKTVGINVFFLFLLDDRSFRAGDGYGSVSLTNWFVPRGPKIYGSWIPRIGSWWGFDVQTAVQTPVLSGWLQRGPDRGRSGPRQAARRSAHTGRLPYQEYWK